jgi:hypothetical protein
MKRIVRLTESDLVRLVKKVIKEQEQTKKISSKLSQGLQNVIPAMIENQPFNGNLFGTAIGGNFQGTYYEWVGDGIVGFPNTKGQRGPTYGRIESDKNSAIIKDLTEKGITDADPNGLFIGFYEEGGIWFRCYQTKSKTVKCYSVK